MPSSKSSQMKMVTIYYNGKCSTCRKALALLEAHGYEAKLINYLQTQPDRAELTAVAKHLGVSAVALLRTKEPVYKELVAKHGEPDETQALDWMAEHARLIQRPIVLLENTGMIARPVERLLEVI